MTEMSGRPYMSSIGISDPLSLDNGHSVASVLFDVQSPPLLHSLFSQGSTSPAVMNPSGDSLFFHSAGQPSVLYSATSSSSIVHAPKRHRDCEEQMIGMNGLKPVSSPALLFNTEQERLVMSSCVSSQITEANNQHYLTAGESDCSSDEDPLGYPGIESDPTCRKMKRIKLDGISAASGNPEIESTRRNQSPACRYDVVRVALLRFRELFGNTCVKRGFVVPSGSADWPEETWGIRLDLVRSAYLYSSLNY
jgi:hypothetical protein